MWPGFSLVTGAMIQRHGLAAHGNDANSWTNRHYFVGPQHVTVHWNGGGLRFAEASAALHVDVPGQYKALVLADIDGDGAPDFIAGGDQQNSRVFVNRVAPAGTSLALRLAGTTSNPLGLGARVDVDVGDGSPVRHLIAGGSVSPYAFAEPLVFAGLGKAAAAARVTITWPSGVTQVIQNVAGGSVHRVAEPPSIVLSPAGRHAPADGRSTVAVVVSPPWPEPVVVLVSGRPAPVAVGPDGKVTATLVAPTQPGVDRVDVRVGDRELGVHPRVWWD